MTSRQVFERVKAATVAFAIRPNPPPPPDRMPFTILGSGFCIDPLGIVVTCEHVIAAFHKKNLREEIAAIPKEEPHDSIARLKKVETPAPEVLFFRFDKGQDQMAIISAPARRARGMLEYDLGAVRLGTHPAFPNGFPFLELEPFDAIFEGMEVGTCGFPMGNLLHAQFGTNSSSFTAGILSSIAPAPEISSKNLRGYQLDITATFGNSGGPVFSMASGKVLGVLQGGPVQPDKSPLPGLARAEPILHLLRDGTIDSLRAYQP